MDDIIVDLTDTPEEPRCVQIFATLAGKVNLADFQNALLGARELSALNETGSDVKGLRLKVSSEPAFLKPKTWHIDQLGAGQTVRISDLDRSLDGTMLGRLAEVLNRAHNIAAGGLSERPR